MRKRMKKIRTLVPMVAILVSGCSQPQGTSAPAATGAMEPNSVTVFTLSLQANSVSGCIMGDPAMTRPVTLTVTNNSAVLLTSGGIHYDLNRVAPNVYAGGYWVKIRADLSTRPKRLTVSNDDGSCNWAATAA
jgi:hypothetical protein